MKTITTTNPFTGRESQVRAWDVDPHAVIKKFHSHEFTSARDLSYALLNDDESIQDMAEEEGGDCADSNFALSVFENALDWTLGMEVVHFIQAAAKIKKIPKPFKVCVTRKGDVFIIGHSGRVYHK